MSDRPRDDDWDWLYDSRENGPPRSEGADLAPPRLPPPSGRRPSSGSQPPRKRGKRPVRLIGWLVVAWLVFLIAVPIWAWSQINRVDAEPDGDRPGKQPGTTYLLVGSDSREGLTAEERKKLTTGSAGGQRTDTVMLMHVGSGPTLLMSIPRDSRVDIPGHGHGKINAAYAYGGAELLVQTIEGETGIRVDDYVEIGFGGFVSIVDALSGVEICPKDPIKDKDAGLDIEAGCQEADGPTALGYSRSRHSYQTQDIQRVQSQREVLGAIASKAKSPWTILNPVRYWRLGDAAADSLVIGDNVGPISLGRFALNLSSAMGGGGLNCTVPLADFTVRWDRDRALKMFEYVKNDDTASIGDLCTQDGLPG